MIEIKELVVRASVNQHLSDPKNGGSDAKYKGDCGQSSSIEGANEDIIDSCVRQVLAILERQKER